MHSNLVLALNVILATVRLFSVRAGDAALHEGKAAGLLLERGDSLVGRFGFFNFILKLFYFSPFLLYLRIGPEDFGISSLLVKS